MWRLAAIMEREYKGSWLFQLKNEMFRQVVAIPMGSNPTSCFKSVFLFLRWKMCKENNKSLKTKGQKDL